eukprot:3297361-Heterocapsa_arctica.AAC.1
MSRQQQGMLTMLRGLFSHTDASWSSALEDAARTKLMWLISQLLWVIEQLVAATHDFEQYSRDGFDTP